MLLSISSTAQLLENVNNDLQVCYQMTYKKFSGSDKEAIENTVLTIKKNGVSYFMFDTMIAIDSIQRVRELSVADIMSIRSPLYYLIKKDADKISHFESFGKDLLKFEESVVFDWKLSREEKKIGGYNCKKAYATYEGRDWIAWYASDIPVSSGPYKFYGLPGLILDLSDSDNLFHFSAYKIKSGIFDVSSKFTNYFVSEGIVKIQQIEKAEFHNIRKKFHQMSLEERVKYMNRGEEGIYGVTFTGTNGEELRINRKPKIKNFIERYDKN